MNSIILTLKTWLIVLRITQVVKYLLKRFKYIKVTKKHRNNKTKKKHTPKQKELLNLFNDLLDTILTNKTLMSSKDKNEKEKEMENDKTLLSSKDENGKQNKFLNNDNNANAKNIKNSPKKAANKKKMRMKLFC